MKKNLHFFCFFFFLIISQFSIGQSKRPVKHNHPSGKQHAVALGPTLPTGNFTSTHIFGFAANYSWSNHRFGAMDLKPVKPFGFTSNAGIEYYFGKKETVSGYPYKYPGYIFLHAYGGAIYNPWRKANIILTAGPALGFYNGQTQFNIGSNLEASFFLKERIAITPGIIMMKESGADPLWAAFIKASLGF